MLCKWCGTQNPLGSLLCWNCNSNLFKEELENEKESFK